MGSMKTKLMAAVSGVVAGLAITATAAMAAPGDPPTVDYSNVTDGVNDQLTIALPAALVLFGIIGGILLGIRFFKRVSGVRN